MALSVVMWLAGGAVVVVGLFDQELTGVGIWLTALGAVLSVRWMLCRECYRQRNAFELGRDYEREDASVSPLRQG